MINYTVLSFRHRLLIFLIHFNYNNLKFDNYLSFFTSQKVNTLPLESHHLYFIYLFILIESLLPESLTTDSPSRYPNMSRDSEISKHVN